MNSLNSILLEGNVVRDPQLSKTPRGTNVCAFSVASNRFYRQEDGLEKEVSFFDVETWAKVAERCGSELKKGRGVRVVGRLKQDRWKDQEGQHHSRIKIVAEHVEFRPQFRKDDEDGGQENEQEELSFPKDAEVVEENEVVNF